MSSSTNATINTPTSCANCSKKEAIDCKLKSCMACKLVKYCSRECQVAHRPQHKKACKKRAAELHDEQLFKEHPERDECPICMLLLPTNPSQIVYQSCCGRTICYGCSLAQLVKEVNSGKDEKDNPCAFCRLPEPTDKERIGRVKRCMEKKIACAFAVFGGYYLKGERGLSKDLTKARDLFSEAGELGCAEGYHNLGAVYHDTGLEQDAKKAKYYFELAAMGGKTLARNALGSLELKAGNLARAVTHYVIGAKAGDERCLTMVQSLFEKGFLTREGHAEALHAYQKQQEETKSPERGEAIKYVGNPDEYDFPKLFALNESWFNTR